jgi:putative hydrolase of the HAD superfamily
MGSITWVLFDYGGVIAAPQPDSEVALLASTAGPPDVVFLDDRPGNVAGAQALGIRGVQFTDPGQARAALAAYGVVATPRS